MDFHSLGKKWLMTGTFMCVCVCVCTHIHVQVGQQKEIS